MLKPYQFHKVSLTLNLDRIITTTQQSTHFPRVFSQSVSLAPSCRWQGGVAEYLHSLHLLGPPHCAALCPSALFSPVLFALTVILPSVKAIENLGRGGGGLNLECSMHLGLWKSFLYSEAGEGNGLNTISLPPSPTKEGISVIKVQRWLKGEVVKILVWLWLGSENYRCS